MNEDRVFVPALVSARTWLHELTDELELDPEQSERALRAMRAGLHAIRDRLPAAEIVDLGAQLPALLRGIYYEGWRLSNDPSLIHTREDMLAHVEHGLQGDRLLSPIAVLRAVIAVLSAHVSTGELVDIVSTLPRPIAELWIGPARP